MVSEAQQLPVTGPFVERIVRIFRDRPDDDASALVLQDYARAALTAGKVDQWQPIETAPEQEIVLAYGKLHGDCGYTDDQYVILQASKPLYSKGWHINQPTGRYFNGFTPTHWMPLPTPPALTTEGE